MSSDRSVGRTAFLGILALALLLHRPGSGHAVDGAVWLWTEHREALSLRPNPDPEWALRIATDFRIVPEPWILSQGFLRIGPLYEPLDWFYVAFHLAGSAERGDSGVYESDLRIEVEPWFEWQVTESLELQTRNRFEARWVAGENQLRYRNMIRAQWKPSDEPWMLLAWDEVIFRVDAPELTENRTAAMVAYQFDRGRRVEWGYMLRVRFDEGEPRVENVFLLSFLVDGTEIVTAERGQVEN